MYISYFGISTFFAVRPKPKKRNFTCLSLPHIRLSPPNAITCHPLRHCYVAHWCCRRHHRRCVRKLRSLLPAVVVSLFSVLFVIILIIICWLSHSYRAPYQPHILHNYQHDHQFHHQKSVQRRYWGLVYQRLFFFSFAVSFGLHSL